MKVNISFEIDGVDDHEPLVENSPLSNTVREAAGAFMAVIDSDRHPLVAGDQVTVRFGPGFEIPGRYLVPAAPAEPAPEA